MKTWLGFVAAVLACNSARATDAVAELSKHLEMTPALVVVVCGETDADLETVTRLANGTPWTIVCRGPVSPELEEIRSWARERTLLGRRVSVLDDNGRSLWLAGDTADAVWIMPGAEKPPAEEEILRVLHPGGVCIGAGRTIVKPAADGTDQWRHPYHEPNNNVVSQDQLARLPGELRFQTHPIFAAMPNQTLFAGGRIFFFSGHIAFHEREQPLLNKLTVLNAYNGLPLWTRPLDPKFVVHNIAKFATDTEVVFAEGPTLWMLDAATGREIRKFDVPPEAVAAGDTDWKWVAQQGDKLWAAFGPPDARVAPFRGRQRMGHWPWNIANEHYRAIVDNFGVAGTLAAFSYPDMEPVWSINESEPFDARALCMDDGRIFQLAPQRYMAARDAATGDPVWRCTPDTSQDAFRAIGNALKRQGWGLGWATYCCARAADDVVCIAGPSFKSTICVSFEDGDLLWSSPGDSPHPFFLDDMLYVMPRVAGPAAGCRAVDPQTGEVLDEFSLGVIGSCTRLTVTPSQFYYRPGGGEGRTVYVDVAQRKLADYEGVVRPGCFDGVVPANGRLYWMPLACDCWQVHGTFCMAPRSPLDAPAGLAETPAWEAPSSDAPATAEDWPIFRADPAGTATVSVPVPRTAVESWRTPLFGEALSAPIYVGSRVYVGSSDGTVWGLDANTGRRLWDFSTRAPVLYPPSYWNGRILFGSCDGFLYCLDASDGRLLGQIELAPERRFVNVMGQFMSAWPLGGGVLAENGIAYTAAGSTATDGAIVAGVDILTGQLKFQQMYTLDRIDPKLSFGVQGNILLNDGKLLVNGGAPVGVVALDTETGESPQIVARLEAGRDMFLEPDGKPICSGPELYGNERARTTIFKQHQGRIYFETSACHIALVDGRLFCSRDPEPLDAIVALMNKDPKTGGKLGGGTEPWDVMQIPVGDSILWAGETSDVRGLAVCGDGLVVLHERSVEGVSADGHCLWTVPLTAPPVPWGIALTGTRCVVTLTDGHVVCVRP